MKKWEKLAQKAMLEPDPKKALDLYNEAKREMKKWQIATWTVHQMKVKTCIHCDRFIVEGQKCYACQNRVLSREIVGNRNEFKKILFSIKYGKQGPVPPKWVIEICDKALDVLLIDIEISEDDFK